MTAEFFQATATHLTADGVVISNLIAGTSGDTARLLMAEVKTMTTAFPEVYVFPVRGADYQDPQNVIILATMLSSPLTKADFSNLAASTTTVRIPALRDYVTNYFSLDTGNAPVLTDNYAPVETLLNPLTGQTLTTGQESTVNWREVEILIVVVLGIAVVFLVLVRKKVL
jgi:hypothetical protein